MSEIEEDEVLQELMNTILLVAMEDGEITDDELAILEQVKLDVKILREALEKMEDQNDDIEADKLRDFRKKLLQNSYEISKEDHVITNDERKMINSLIQYLME